jgi:hypothetical protein
MHCLLVFIDNITVQCKNPQNTQILRQIPTQRSLVSVKYVSYGHAAETRPDPYIDNFWRSFFVVSSPSVRRDIFFTKNVKENLKHKNFLTVSGMV